MTSNRCNDPGLDDLGDEVGSDVCGCSRAGDELILVPHNGLIVPHTREEWERFQRDVDWEAARLLSEE